MHKVALGAVVVAFGALSASGGYAESMEVTSAEVHKGATIKNEQVFKGFGCTGDNISPSLSWTGAPKGTKSFAITVYDPDARTGSGWLALGSLQHSGIDHIGAKERRRREREAYA
jgi:hypothetical protein